MPPAPASSALANDRSRRSISDLKGWLSDYVQVRSVVHEPSLHEAVRAVQGKCWVDRLEATVEAHIMAAASVREACGIPGTLGGDRLPVPR